MEQSGVEEVVNATTFDDVVGEDGGNARGRVLNELDKGLTLIDLNATVHGVAPHGDGVGLVNLELKHKVEEMLHITQRRRRRGLGSSWPGRQ